MAHKNTSLGIQSPCQMMIGVYNHLRKARYLGSITILSFGDWIPRAWDDPPSIHPFFPSGFLRRKCRIHLSSGFKEQSPIQHLSGRVFQAKKDWRLLDTKKNHRIHGTGIFTPWKINGWNLQITHKKKGK